MRTPLLSSPPAQTNAKAKEAVLNTSLAIARIFGGFGPSFFTEYHAHRPKSEPVDEYEERMILYELFHYLNHTLMFGVSRECVLKVMGLMLLAFELGKSGYAGQSKGHMRKLLKFADSKGI